MLAKLRGNKSHPTKNTKHRSFVSSKTWFESEKTDPHVNRLKGFHRAPVLVETFATTSETCSTGWGQRLALCTTLLPPPSPSSATATWLVRPPRHISTCHPLLLASPFVTVPLPLFPFPFLPSALHHTPDHTALAAHPTVPPLCTTGGASSSRVGLQGPWEKCGASPCLSFLPVKHKSPSLPP